ncbi:MAG: Smr/MutS family protein [Anaerolineaceae bacterium]|nr:Smr/MutS family protein [Anaerolineaceae bacterium]
MGKIDLHDLTVREALERFTAYYNRQIGAGNRATIEVVHGYGSSGEGGKIRKRLRRLLDRHPDRVQYVRGETISANPGVTYVDPILSLPSNGDVLETEILAYCEVPRSKEKIHGEFRRYSDQQVRGALRRLEKSKQLRVLQKGAYKHYLRAD